MPKRQKSPRNRAKSEHLVIISCRAPRSLRDRLDLRARQDRRSTSSFLRLLLEDHLLKPRRNGVEEDAAIA
jgi:hypothetical protein